MIFGILGPIPNTLPKIKNLSQSERFSRIPFRLFHILLLPSFSLIIYFRTELITTAKWRTKLYAAKLTNASSASYLASTLRTVLAVFTQYLSYGGCPSQEHTTAATNVTELMNVYTQTDYKIKTRRLRCWTGRVLLLFIFYQFQHITKTYTLPLHPSKIKPPHILCKH